MSNKIQTQVVEETMLMMQQKQGIVTILGDTPSSASSLPRALSADMSVGNNKCLSHQNMIPSSEQLLHSSTKTIAHDSFSSSSSSSEDEAERERLEIWSSIQRNKKEEQEKAFDMWSSLVSLKDNNNEISKSLPVSPYIHPLVKRSKSCLSEKSLEICTESLGSETGSHHALFPSYPPPSETGDADHKQEEEEKVTEEEAEELRYNHGVAATTNKTPPRSFPPPLPSLSSRQTAGPSLHMRSRRDNGRLVLEAVSLPSQNNFCVQRQDGRLVLTFANQEETKEDSIGDENYDPDGLLEEEFEEEEHEEDIDDEDVESVIEKAALKITATDSVGSLALMMNKPIGLVNRNPKWSEKFDQVETGPLAQSQLPPRVPRLIPSTAAASFNFNAYEYFWRAKPTSKDATLTHQKHNTTYSTLNNNSTSKLIVSADLKHVSNERQQLLVLRGKNGDYMVHNLESCKDSRRSFLFWEPYCIAT